MTIISILILVFFINLQLISSEYKLSWFPKDKYFDSIKTPENNKFSLINTAGVWEDNRGSFGVMKCLISLFTKEKRNKIIRLTFKISMAVFFGFSIFDILFGDRMELWKHGTLLILATIHYVYILFIVPG